MLDRHDAVLGVLLLVFATFSFSAPPPMGKHGDIPNVPGFIANVGQLSTETVRLYRSSPAMQVGFADGAVLYRMQSPSDPSLSKMEASGVEQAGVLVRGTFRESGPVRPVGRGELQGRANYFLGNDPARWRTGVPTYREVAYASLWPGISAIYRATAEGVKYSYELRAGADVGSIAIEYEGAEHVRLAGEELVVETAIGELRDSPPIAEQGGRPVACAFRILDPRTAGITCPKWDRAQPGVIDPLVWATYVGASGRDDLRSVAVDSAGFVYVAGHTGSTDFPVSAGAFRTTYGGGFYDTFVAKFRPGGDQLEWATYLGGSAEEYGLSLALDAGGAYVTGYTTSADFPTLGALDPDWNGTDAFVAKIALSGDALLYSTFLGGTGEDAGEALAVASDGSVIVTGVTGSMDFPTTPGAPSRSHNGGFFDAFVAKLDPAGASLTYGTYLGGSQLDTAVAVALDATGAAYVTGGTLSMDFPATPNAFDRTYNDIGPIPAGDAFLTKLNPSGTGYAYSTFLGGAAADSAWGVRVDNGARAYVIGYTESANFPTTPGARNETYIGGGDAFVTAVSPQGDALVASTFLGGTGADQPFALQLDVLGRPYVAGSTTSTDFPVTPDAPDLTQSGGRDAFVAFLNASLDSVLFGTFFGGSGHDDLYALAIDPAAGNAYLGGLTLSTDLPTTPGAFDRTCGTDGTCDFDGVQSYIDGFLAKMKVANPVTVNITVATSPPALRVRIDAIEYTSPHTFACLLGSDHVLDAPSPQIAGSTQYLFDRWSDGTAQNHTISCDADAAITAQFFTERQTFVSSIPTGLAIYVDFTPIVTPGTFWWRDGSSHMLDAVSPQASAGTRWTFTAWSDLGARAHLVTVAGPQNYTASFLTEYDMGISSVPVGLIIEIDTVPVVTPYSFWCSEGTQHEVNALSPQTSGPVRRLFRTWFETDAPNYTFQCSAPAELTAAYDTEYEVTVDTSPLFLQVSVNGVPFTAPRTFWCAANSTRTLDATTPQGSGLTRYVFASWSDTLPRTHSVTCTAPTTYLAAFETQHWVSVDSNPPGLLVTVDGSATNAPAGFWWREGSSHTLDVPTPQLETDTRYTFATWADGPSGARTIVVTGPATYVARFDVEFAVTLTTDPPGLNLEVDGVIVATPFAAWWMNGSAHTVWAPSPQIGTPGVRYVFDAWGDAGDQVLHFQTAGALALTAAFRTQYRLALSSKPFGTPIGTPTCDKADCWYDPGDSASFDIQATVNVTAGSRYAFDRWTGNVSQERTNGTIVMNGPKFAAALWRIEYFLRVDSAYGTTTGEGWYREGARATFSVSQTDVVSMGRQFSFDGWSGDTSIGTARGSIVMDGARVVTAKWRESSELSSWICLSLPVVLVAFLLLLLVRRGNREPPSEESGPRRRVAAFVTSVRTKIRLRR